MKVFLLVLIFALVLLAMTGCGTLATAPKETLIPIPTKCLTADQIPEGTFLTDAQMAAMNDGELVLAIRGDQISLRNWHDLALPLLQSCSQ